MVKDVNDRSIGIFRDFGLIDERFRASRVFEELVRAFRDNVPLGRHMYHFKMYNNCFVASEAVTWFMKQIQLSSVPLFSNTPSRQQVIQIFVMFYQPWIQVFTDVRGSQFDKEKPHFADSQRLFRLNENYNYTLLQSPRRVIQSTVRANDMALHDHLCEPDDECDHAKWASQLTTTPPSSALRKVSSETMLSSEYLSQNLVTVHSNSLSDCRSKFVNASGSIMECHRTCKNFTSHGVEDSCSLLGQRRNIHLSSAISSSAMPAISVSKSNSHIAGRSRQFIKFNLEDSKQFSIVARDCFKKCFGGFLLIDDFSQLSSSTDYENLFDGAIIYQAFVTDTPRSITTEKWPPQWVAEVQRRLLEYRVIDGISEGHVTDLLKLLRDYCSTWTEPLLPYRLYNTIAFTFERLQSGVHDAGCSPTKDDRGLVGWVLNPLYVSRPEQGGLEPCNVEYIRSVEPPKSDRKSSVMRNRTTVGAASSNDGCTVPYFPRVTALLRQANRMTHIDGADCFEDGGSIMVDTSVVSFADQLQDFCELKQCQTGLGAICRSQTVFYHESSSTCHQALDTRCNLLQNTEIPTDRVITGLQFCCLLMTSAERCKLYVFIEFLNKLVAKGQLMLNQGHSTRQLVLETFLQYIIGCEDRDLWNKELVTKVVGILLDDYTNILKPPAAFVECFNSKKDELKLSFSGSRLRRVLRQQNSSTDRSSDDLEASTTFCEQVSREQYERQKRHSSHEALLQLLNSITSDVTMSPSTKRRRLRQYQLTYPELCAQLFPAMLPSELLPSNDDAAAEAHESRRLQSSRLSHSRLLRRSVSRLRSLRL